MFAASGSAFGKASV